MRGTTEHSTVLLHEAVQALMLKEGVVVVDATLGDAGHSRLIAETIGKRGILVSCDIDQTAIRRVEHTLTSIGPKVYTRNANFSTLKQVLQELQIDRVHAVLADLGWRQEQFGGLHEEGGGKGLSFHADEPLIMTYGDPADYPFIAHDIVNTWSRDSLVSIIRGYGEERYAMRIAEAIVQAREINPVATATQLAEIITGAVPFVYRRGRIHPATRTFQALRIAVNNELGVLESFITDAVSVLVPHGRLVIITFHSLEDRVVKKKFRELADRGVGEIITKKPIIPSQEEVFANPRARSAKMRIFSAF